MKKVLSFVMALFILACMLLPVCADETMWPESVYFSFENESDFLKVGAWDISISPSIDGVCGSGGAAQIQTSSDTAGIQWYQYLEPGRLYNDPCG